MQLDTQTLLIALLVLVIILVIWIIRLEWKMGRMLRGKGAKTLEDSIIYLSKEIDGLRNFEKKTVADLDNADRRIQRSIQAVQTIRFNPFKGTGAGGNQSFASAFVSEKGDGVVISSLYSRDRVSIFAKALGDFHSEFELSEEEKEVVKKAETIVK